MSKKIYLLLIFVVSLGGSLFSQIHINEYSASNLNQFQDNFIKFEDWIELHNAGSDAVDLEGWWLSDKADKPQKWRIPAGITIPANGFLTFWCSGRDTVINNFYHTNFKLSQTKTNETLVLSEPNGNILESIPLELTLVGHSRCRETDGASDWKVCTVPTIRRTNNNASRFSKYTSTPVMPLPAGFYAGQQTITIAATESNSVMHYTTDGSMPTTSSPEYVDPIVITKTTVVKARSFSNDPAVLPGKIVYNTYFIDEDFTLDVFSVAADRVQDLASGQGEVIPVGTLEYFNKDKERVAKAYGSLNRHGQDSWALDHRSLDWVTRDEMGYTRTVEAKLFSYSDRDEYQRFMFRASGDDNYPAINDGQHEFSTHLRDEYVHTLAQDGGMEVDLRAVERVILFLDGKYWGVYGMRERPVDHDYTSEYYDQGKYDIQYLTTWGTTEAEYGGQGAFNDWGNIRDFVLNNDMSVEANYEMVEDNINLLSLIDYMIANLNSVASDWLNYNTGWWRGLDPDGGHKKWGYILWDNDATFDYYINYSGVPDISPNAKPCDIDEIADFMDQFFNGYGGEDVGKHEKIFLKLQDENETFKQLYYSRQADLMNTVYTCENMLSTLDRMVAVIAPEMPRQIQRWGGSMNEWEQNVERLRNFIEQRCTRLDDGMLSCFSELDGPHELTLRVEPEGIGVGEIDLNTLDIEAFPWTGAYFGGMDNKIKAKSFDDDYEFMYWKSASGNVIFPDANARRATIRLTQADTLTAVFGIPVNTAVSDVASEFDLQLFPNPASDLLVVDYELEESTDISISLQSVVGKEMIHFPEAGGKRSTGTYREILDLPKDLAAGLYFVRFQAGNKQATLKVTIVD